MTTRRSPLIRSMTVVAGLASAIAASGVLLACESDQAKATTPESRAAAVPAQHDEYAKLGYRVEWRGFPTMSPGHKLERMDLLGDVIAVQEGGSVLTIMETRSGERRWSDPVASPLTKFLGTIRDHKQVIISSETQAFFYDLDTGALLNKQKFAQVVNTRPLQVGPILVYGCANGQVLGHLTLNGFRQWGSYLSGSIEVDPIRIGENGLIGLVSRRGDVLILDGSNGFAKGRNNMFGGTDVEMAASDTAMFVASNDHSLYAFSTEGASEMWRKRTDAPLKFAPTFQDGKVYCDMGTQGLTCFDAANGKELWNDPKAHGTVLGMRNKRLLAWDGGNATTLDPADGAVIESIKLDNVSLVKTDKFVDGSLYLGSPAGVVTKLTPR